MGNRVRYEEFEKLPEGFSVENSPDESFGGKTKCSGSGWNVEGNQLRYSWTPCVSTLSISLHLTRPGFAEFKYQISRESRGLIQMLQWTEGLDFRTERRNMFSWSLFWLRCHFHITHLFIPQ